jgi:hypothetical protein
MFRKKVMSFSAYRRKPRAWVYGFLAWLICCQAAGGAEPLRSMSNGLRHVHRAIFENKKVHAPKDPCVETVAREIDWLEHQIETYGTIVPKHPDIWGEARLTKHRHEYEREIAETFQQDQFHVKLQGAIRRSDQSYLAMAFALNDVTPGGGSVAQASTLIQPVSTPSTDQAGTIVRSSLPGLSRFDLPEDSTSKQPSYGIEPVIESQQLSRYLNHLNELRRINEGDDTADTPGYSLNLIRVPISVLPGKKTRKGYGAEATFTVTPVLSDDLLPSTMRSLIIQDVVDQNALPIARLLNNDPDEAKAYIEKFVEIEPRVERWMYVYDRWLTDTEVLAQNGSLTLREQANIAYLHAIRPYLFARFVQFASRAKSDCDEPPLDAARPIPATLDAESPWAIDQCLPDGPRIRVTYTEIARWFDGLYRSLARPEPYLANIRVLVDDVPHIVGLKLDFDGALRLDLPRARILPLDTAMAVKEDKGAAIMRRSGEMNVSHLAPAVADRKATQRIQSFLKTPYLSTISKQLDKLTKFNFEYAITYGSAVPVGPGMNARTVSRKPLTPAEHLPTYGFSAYLHLATEAMRTLRVHPANEGVVHDYDIRQYLKIETERAYDMLLTEQGIRHWAIATPELVQAIRGGDFTFVYETRRSFLQELPAHIQNTETATLAWGILVEAALLNEKLTEEMVRLGQAKGCMCMNAEGTSFIGPKELLAPQAHEMFHQYVQCRWPIVVFALDPVTDDQNIADVYSRRREMMLAVSIAVANGSVSPSAAGRFVRRLETDIETIALNRTAVAFSHGNDTFGWRFYPRVQTPDTPGTLGAFSETLLGGPSRDADIRDRQLEATQRECTAIVIMPSFVPYVTVDSRANWFCVTNPRAKEWTLHDTMKISRSYQAIRETLDCAQNPECYRAGDVAMLGRVLDQLDRKMPLQSMTVQVPYENTLGGFDLFEQSTTCLAPQVDGWYGAPGIDPNSVTRLYLIGDRFSVHETRVIAGGRECPFRLLSRQIMEISVPPGAQPLKQDGTPQWVDVQVATPYGISSHQLVPMVQRVPTDGRFIWATSAVGVEFQYKRVGDSNTFTSTGIFANFPPEIGITTPTLGTNPEIDVNLTISRDVNGQLQSLATTGTSTTVKARLDPRTKRYVIDGSNFHTFALLIQTAAGTANTAQPIVDGQTEQWIVQANVKAANSGALDPILGAMTVDVTFRKVP